MSIEIGLCELEEAFRSRVEIWFNIRVFRRFQAILDFSDPSTIGRPSFFHLCQTKIDIMKIFTIYDLF